MRWTEGGFRALAGAVTAGLGRLALVVGSVTVALLGLEGAFRVAGYARGLDYRVYLQELVNPGHIPWRIWNGTGSLTAVVAQAYTRYPPLRPGAAELSTSSEFSVIYQINAQGLRDREYDYARRPGTARAVALGDSFTFGSGVRYGERFTDVAEERLGDVEIIDMGVPGYGLEQVLLSFIVEGRRYRPDAAIVFVNRYVLEREALGLVVDGVVRIPDEVATLMPAPRSDANTAYLTADDPVLAQAPVLVRRSYLLSWLTYRLRLRQLRERLVESDSRTLPLTINRGATAVDSHRGRRTRATALIAALRDRCLAAGARVIVVNIDDFYRYPYLGKIPDVVFHDLADELHRRDLVQPVRFRFDRHYTPATNRFLGERLAELLRADLATSP
jgi:hypothetical protein